MARTSRKIVTLAVLGAGLFGTYKLGSALLCDAAASARLHNQVWIERLPTDERDMIHHLVLVEDGGDRVGAFGKSSTWRHFIEIFLWKSHGQSVTFDLPQDRRRLELGWKAWDCEGQAPRGFQLCLELTNKRGKAVTYYSRHDWRIDDASPEGLEKFGADHPELAPVLKDMQERPAPVDASAFELADDLLE